MNQSNAGVPANHIAGTNFIMVHLDLVDDLDGDFHAALLLDRIRFRAGDGWWTATRDQLMADTRLNEYHLKRAIKTLRDMGFLETERVSAYDATLKYRVIIAATTEKANSAVSGSRIAPPETANSAGSDVANSAVSTSTKNSKELSKNPPISPIAFDEFYKAYPRKKQRGQAERAWDKAIKHTDPAVIIAGAVQFRQWCEQDSKDAQFIPYPSTWLNGKGWLDERDPEPQGRMQGWVALLHEAVDNDSQSYPQLEG